MKLYEPIRNLLINSPGLGGSAIRFIITGIASAVSEFYCFVLLNSTFDVTSVVICQSVSFLLGFIISFTSNRYFVFDARSNLRQQVIRYGSLAIFNLCLGVLLIHILVAWVGTANWVAKISVMLFVSSINFFINRFYIFKKSPS